MAGERKKNDPELTSGFFLYPAGAGCFLIKIENFYQKTPHAE